MAQRTLQDYKQRITGVVFTPAKTARPERADKVYAPDVRDLFTDTADTFALKTTVSTISGKVTALEAIRDEASPAEHFFKKYLQRRYDENNNLIALRQRATYMNSDVDTQINLKTAGSGTNPYVVEITPDNEMLSGALIAGNAFTTFWEGAIAIGGRVSGSTNFLKVSQRVSHIFPDGREQIVDTRPTIIRIFGTHGDPLPLSTFNSVVMLDAEHLGAPITGDIQIKVELIFEMFTSFAATTRKSWQDASIIELLVDFEVAGLTFMQGSNSVGPAGPEGGSVDLDNYDFTILFHNETEALTVTPANVRLSFEPDGGATPRDTGHMTLVLPADLDTSGLETNVVSFTLTTANDNKPWVQNPDITLIAKQGETQLASYELNTVPGDTTNIKFEVNSTTDVTLEFEGLYRFGLEGDPIIRTFTVSNAQVKETGDVYNTFSDMINEHIDERLADTKGKVGIMETDLANVKHIQAIMKPITDLLKTVAVASETALGYRINNTAYTNNSPFIVDSETLNALIYIPAAEASLEHFKIVRIADGTTDEVDITDDLDIQASRTVDGSPYFVYNTDVLVAGDTIKVYRTMVITSLEVLEDVKKLKAEMAGIQTAVEVIKAQIGNDVIQFLQQGKVVKLSSTTTYTPSGANIAIGKQFGTATDGYMLDAEHAWTTDTERNAAIGMHTKFILVTKFSPSLHGGNYWLYGTTGFIRNNSNNDVEVLEVVPETTTTVPEHTNYLSTNTGRGGSRWYQVNLGVVSSSGVIVANSTAFSYNRNLPTTSQVTTIESRMVINGNQSWAMVFQLAYHDATGENSGNIVTQAHPAGLSTGVSFLFRWHNSNTEVEIDTTNTSNNQAINGGYMQYKAYNEIPESTTTVPATTKWTEIDVEDISVLGVEFLGDDEELNVLTSDRHINTGIVRGSTTSSTLYSSAILINSNNQTLYVVRSTEAMGNPEVAAIQHIVNANPDYPYNLYDEKVSHEYRLDLPGKLSIRVDGDSSREVTTSTTDISPDPFA